MKAAAVSLAMNATVALALCATLLALSAWLQFGVLGRDARAATTTDADARIDYYIERFASVGVGADGRKYRLDAARLEHYPADGGARLHRPRIVQYDLTGATRRIRADSGWLRNDGAEAILTGNVHVHENAAAASVARSQRMLIRLK